MVNTRLELELYRRTYSEEMDLGRHIPREEGGHDSVTWAVSCMLWSCVLRLWVW